MKFLVFLEVDVTIRHFVHSGAFSELAKKHDVAFVFPEEGHKRLGPVKPSTLDLGTARRLTLPCDRERLKLWRFWFFTQQLRGAGKMPRPQLASLRRLFRIGNGWKGYLLYRAFGLPGVFQVFEKIVNRRLRRMPNQALDDLLDAERPDAVIHPCVLEGLYINDLVEAGVRHDIPVVVVMNSWDNPASKRAVVGTDYWLLVWGEQTRQHALQFMNMPADRVISFGAAQFDIYREQPDVSRDDLLKAHGLDPGKPALLYAGSSKETDEYGHLCRIEEAIEEGRLPPMGVIYRPHPWGNGGKDGTRFLTHDWTHIAVEVGMRDYLARVAAGDTSKSLPSYALTRDLLSAVDAVASPLSTILIEGMLLGKPGLCFMPVEEKGALHFQLARQQVHFSELLSAPEIVVAWRAEDLVGAVAEVMKRASNPDVAERVRRCASFFVQPYGDSFSKRIVSFLEELVVIENNNKGCDGHV